MPLRRGHELRGHHGPQPEPDGCGPGREPGRLDAGDLLAIYTDGITEAFDAQDGEFGEGRLVETLHAHRHLPPRDVIAAIYDGVRRFSPQEQRDDMTLIVARCKDC